MALRIARRETLRAKGRSALVLALIMLPVLVVTVGSTLLRTALVSTVESIPREMGAADAAVRPYWEVPVDEVMVQCPDLSCTAVGDAIGDPVEQVPPEDAIRTVLGEDARIVAVPAQYLDLTVGDRTFTGLISEADLTDPVFAGMLELVDGRAPAAPGEIAVSEPVAERGAGIGTSLDLDGYGTAAVVGVVRSYRAPDEVVGAPGKLGVPFLDKERLSEWSRWLVDVPGGVSWEQVLQLNARGLTVLSRQVVTDPPTDSELAADPRTSAIARSLGVGSDDTAIAVIGLIVAMVLLEVVLLAGPAFAVSASSQTRALGLVAAQGGMRRQLRRIVLAQAVVLGATAGILGVLLGLLLSRLAYPLLMGQVGPAQIGPFEVGWGDLAAVALFGFGSAVVAALAPARAAARMDPVRAIAGRRPEARTTRWHPVIGVVLIGIGIALAGVGAAGPSAVQGAGSQLIAMGAIAAVIGVVLIAPLAIRLLARLAGGAPLSLRYALRDMARNQLRAAPAVAAVAAVVAGAVALSISGSSDSTQSRTEYVPSGPRGDAVVHLVDKSGDPIARSTWQDLADELAQQNAGAATILVSSVPDPYSGESGARTLMLTESTVLPEHHDWVVEPGTPGAAEASYIPAWWFGSGVLVGKDGLEAVRSALADDQYADARAALADGSAVVLQQGAGPRQGTATFDTVARPGTLESIDLGDPEELESLGRVTVPAIGLHVPGMAVPAAAIIPDAIAEQAGVEPTIAALVIDFEQDLTRADEERLQNAVDTSPTLSAAGLTGYVSLEVGWVNDLRYVLLILGLGAGVLVFAGSMTAALLALSDARADFATLGAVGAAPRTRRRIAGAYGWAIASVGAVLGAVVGFIPGVAITYPLTSSTGKPFVHQGLVGIDGTPIADHYLAIPWPMIAVLVIVLPIVVGLIVALFTRSKLPMVARIE